MFAEEALNTLLDKYKFETVLDVGSGNGDHSHYFHAAGKKVTAVDLKPLMSAPFKTIAANYTDLVLSDCFDCIWLSHVLEHQLDTHSFLRKVHGNLKEGGVLAITVPPMKQEIVGGHVSLWNMGLLLYRLILAGFDCKEAIGKRYGYNISVIVRKASIIIDWATLRFDSGDIEILAQYFPIGRPWEQGFYGEFENINWQSHPLTPLP